MRCAVLGPDSRTVVSVPSIPGLQRALETPTLQNFCPMVKRWMSPVACLDCRLLDAVVSVDPAKMGTIPRDALRISCGAATVRPLTPTGRKMDAGWQKDILEKARILARIVSKAERQTLVEAENEVSCPLAKRTAGTWKVLGPVCVGCPHYRGLAARRHLFKRTDYGVICQTPHLSLMRSVVNGSAMLGRI